MKDFILSKEQFPSYQCNFTILYTLPSLMKTKFRLHCIRMFLVLSISYLPVFGNSQNLPPLTVTIFDSSATKGYYFLSPYTNGTNNLFDRSHQILDQYGRLVFYQIITSSNLNPTIDFKLQPNGLISFFHTVKLKWYFMDSTFSVVDSIQCQNFISDQHDIQLLPNKHYLMFGEETRIMNLSSYHWFGWNHTQPGSTNAEVNGVVIQEFDESKALVWEWKAFDHFQFADVDQRWLFLPNKVDWTHANSVEMDYDGNVLLSSRHFNEITKIDHTTGDIIWRLGGKQNQFSFPNDPVRFTGQHDIRRVSDTSITLFDNGQYTTPAVCRGLEYALDEVNKVATLVWEYIYDSSMYSVACGSLQYKGIDNGNRLVDFGFNTGDNPWMVVVKQDKSKVLECRFPEKYISYRAFNYTTLPWQLNRPAVDCQKIGNDYYLVAEPGHPSYKWSTGATTESIKITTTGEYWVFVPYGVGFLCSERIKITDIQNPCLYLSVPTENSLPETSLQLFPNPATDQTVIRFSLPEKSEVSLTITNTMGAVIRRLVQEKYVAGTHEVNLNVSGLCQGIYVVSLQTDQKLVTTRLMVR